MDRALAVILAGVGPDAERDAYPGAVAAVARNGRLAALEAYGWAALAPDPVPLAPDAVFDVASITKVAVTTPSILLLLERGALSLEDQLERFFPELSGRSLGQARVSHLLTHTAGLPNWFPLAAEAPRCGGVLQALAAAPLAAGFGERVEYSCAGFILLGLLVERLTGEGLSTFAAREVLLPLGLTETTYLPLDRPVPESLRPRLVPTEVRLLTDRGRELAEAMRQRGAWLDEWAARHPEGLARGVADDENAAYLGGVAGNAGLFSTAPDLLAYGQAWLDLRAAKRTDRLLSPATAAVATRNWTAGREENRGLGWQLPGPGSSLGDRMSPSSFGHSGFTGTGLW
ncbi:MAG: serine hydrolase domain-containing protein, partial [Methanocella sp.]